MTSCTDMTNRDSLFSTARNSIIDLNMKLEANKAAKVQPSPQVFSDQDTSTSEKLSNVCQSRMDLHKKAADFIELQLQRDQDGMLAFPVYDDEQLDWLNQQTVMSRKITSSMIYATMDDDVDTDEELMINS